MFIAALFTIAKIWINLSAHQQMNGERECDIYIRHGYYSVLESEKIFICDYVDEPEG